LNRISFLLTTFLWIAFTVPFSTSAEIDWHMPEIDSISETKAFNNGPIRLTIIGKRFNSGTTVKLVKEGIPDIVATDLVINKNTIYCSFNLQDQPIGNWSLVVTNTWSSGRKTRTATLKNAIIIDFAGPAIDSIYPKEIDYPNPSLIQAKIFGAYFRDGVNVRLIGPNGQYTEGIRLKLLVDTQINCEFNLRGLPTGFYDLIVTNVDGKSASFKKCFRIKENEPDPQLIKKLRPVKGQTPIQEMKPLGPDTVQASKPTPTPVIQNETKYTPEISDPKNSLGPLAAINQKLKPIFFDVNQSNIRDSELPSLENNLILLKNNPGFLVVICGYADSRGNKAYNLKLTQKRAETIRQFLAANGITEKMSIFLFGNDTSTRAGNNENQWQQSRRVEISLWEKQPTREQVAALSPY
jgi:outer membrane protein OmpA-like peptidoglycan-associated protein